MTPERQQHFQENLGLNNYTPEQLEKVKTELKEKIDTLKADGSFSGEDLKELVDLLDDKTILSPTEAELKSHLETLNDLNNQIDFLMALVEIGEEKSGENVGENNNSVEIEVMNDIEFKENIDGLIKIKVIDLIINLSKKENITEEEINILIKELDGLSLNDIKEFIKKENISDEFKNIKLEVIDNFEKKLAKLPEKQKEKFEIVNSVNQLENTIDNLMLKLKYKEIEHGNKEYKEEINKILQSNLFSKNEKLKGLFLFFTGGEEEYSVFGNNTINVDYLLSFFINTLNGNKTNKITKNEEGLDLEADEDFLKELIKSKEDIYLLKLGIKLLTPPEKYDETIKKIYQGLESSDIFFESLENSEDYNIIEENSNFLKEDKKIQEKYKELKPKLTNEKINEIYKGKENYINEIIGKIGKDKEIDNFFKENQELDLKEILNSFFDSEGNIQVEVGINKAYEEFKGKKGVEKIFDKFCEVLIDFEKKQDNEKKQNLSKDISELEKIEFEKIPDKAKKYFIEKNGKYIINSDKLYKGFEEFYKNNNLDLSKNNSIFTGTTAFEMQAFKNTIIYFLESLGIENNINDENDLYNISMIIISRKNSLNKLENKTYLDTKGVYEHLSKGGTLESFIEITKDYEQKVISSGNYYINKEKGEIYSKDGKQLELSDNEKEMIKSNEKLAENIINLYESLEKVGLSKLWNFRENIFKSIENTFNLQFDRKDGNYLDERETKILLNSILVSIGEQPLKTGLNMEAFLTEIENRNGKQITGTEKQINNYSETKFENLFIEKFVGRGDMIGFKQSAFEASLK